MIGWHFTSNKLRDGRPVPPVGEKLVHDGKLEMCASGLHFSLHPSDALEYAPGAMLHRVECGGEIVMGDDKGVCTERTILASIDATHLLRRFAADQALSVAHLWDMPDVVRGYLTTLDDSKRDAARAAASAAAIAAWDAARDAAMDAAMAAASAAWDAARDAAMDAAMAAASAAASAAWAAASAARAAASAAWDAAMDDLDRRVFEAFGVEVIK